jgi:hypothetical protein
VASAVPALAGRFLKILRNPMRCPLRKKIPPEGLLAGEAPANRRDRSTLAMP